jgi:hypothetical protein
MSEVCLLPKGASQIEVRPDFLKLFFADLKLFLEVCYYSIDLEQGHLYPPYEALDWFAIIAIWFQTAQDGHIVSLSVALFGEKS